ALRQNRLPRRNPVASRRHPRSTSHPRSTPARGRITNSYTLRRATRHGLRSNYQRQSVEETMKTAFKSWIVRLLALVMTLVTISPVALAQDRVPFRQEELDQMLAPVALYPDSLLSQILMASTYPLEVVQAARWSRANSGLRGQDAVR